MAGTFSAHYYHIVFSTKARADLITVEIEPRLYEYIGGIIRGEGGHLVKVGGVEDHIHLLVSLGPKHCLSDLVRVVKSKATRWVKETFPDEENFAWQEGFGSFTVSQSNLAAVQSYLEKQREHHRVKTFKDEFREFLVKHDVEFDEETIWL
jgi:putative transposase